MKTIIFLFFFLMVSCLSVLAQVPPPPPDPSNGGANGPVGGNAPVGSGLTIMLVLGAAWAGKKAYQITKIEETL